MGMLIGFTHTMKVRELPNFVPFGELDTFEPVFAKARTKRTIPGMV